MLVKKLFSADKTISKNSVVTIGNFDGVHLGHQILINKTVRLASNLAVESIVVTFDPHPIEVLNPFIGFEYISNLKEDTNFIKAYKVSKLLVIPFSKEIAILTANEFLTTLFQMVNPKVIVVGRDHRFGYNRQGDLDTLLSFAKAHGILIKIVEPVQIDGVKISSTCIRDFIKKGSIEKVNSMLGRCFRLSGAVVQGAKRGMSLGFPTANLIFENRVLPSAGVYSTQSIIDGDKYKSVTYVGKSPTFSGKSFKVETHIIDFDQYIYNRELKVDFYSKIRDDIRFVNRFDLIRQIRQDVEEVRSLD